jgi:lipoprotein-anchoring transpeptidase ErfK/SrfK
MHHILTLFAALFLLIPISNANTNLQQKITVNLSNQTLTAFENGQTIFQFPCSTGKNNGTPRGNWPIKEKVRHNKSLPEYGSVPIPFSLRLNILHKGKKPRIAIHAHKSVPRYPASHGCIRLKYPDAEKLYTWAKIGTIVEIQ